MTPKTRFPRLGPLRRRAFTMMELMVTMSVIVILVTILAWAGTRSTTQAKIQETDAILRSLHNAIQIYRNTQGSYPGWIKDQSGSTAYYGIPFDPNGANPPIKSFPPIDVSSLYLDIQPREDYFRIVNNNCVFTTYKPNGANGYSETSPEIISPQEDYRVFSTHALTYFLRRNYNSKKILNAIPDNIMKSSRFMMAVTKPDGQEIPAVEAFYINDVWGTPLYYGYSKYVNNGVPFLWSAGPDGLFQPDFLGNPDDPDYGMRPLETSDDIVSYQMK